MQIFLPASESFRFERPDAWSFNVPLLIVVLALNFGILAVAVIAAWRFFL